MVGGVWLPHPGQAVFVGNPLPHGAAGGGGKAHSPLPKAASLGEEGSESKYLIFFSANVLLNLVDGAK